MTGFLARVRRGIAVRARNHWYRNHRIYGRVIELLGNRATLDGVRIRLDNPAITTDQKVAFPIGEYELAERQLLRYLPPELPLIDLGASIGVISCIANRRLKDPSLHVAVEANPQLLRTLEQNRDLNDCGFNILHAALAYGADSVEFHLHSAFTSGSLGGEGEAVTVPARTLKSIAEEARFERFNLICDIEGGELGLINEEAGFLAERADRLMIEMHDSLLGRDTVDTLDSRLKEHRFQLDSRLQNVYLYRRIPGGA